MNDLVYKHTQVGLRTMVLMLLSLVFVAVLSAMRGAWSALVIASIVVVPLVVVFSSMTISVTRGFVEWWLSFGMLRQRISIDDIVSARAEEQSALGGLGIRLNGIKSRWSIGGGSAATIVRSDGRQVSLGTDDVERLLRAIHQVM